MTHERWSRFGVSILGNIVGALVIVLLLVTIFGQDTTHEDLNARVGRIEQNQAVIICLLTEQGTFAECLALGPVD
jgi:hypothetical protein